MGTVQIWTADQRPHWMFYAKRAIEPGEALCVDYGENFWREYTRRVDRILVALEPMRLEKDASLQREIILQRENADLRRQLQAFRLQADGTACTVCNSLDNDEKMLLCDGCNIGCHIFCHTPKLNAVPEGDWFCKRCAMNSISS